MENNIVTDVKHIYKLLLISGLGLNTKLSKHISAFATQSETPVSPQSDNTVSSQNQKATKDFYRSNCCCSLVAVGITAMRYASKH